MQPSAVRLRTFGSPSLAGDKGRLSGTGAQPKSLALLALLAVAGERGVSRDKVVAYLWPETETQKAAHRLSQVLHALRRELEADTLFLGTNDLRLNPQVISTDIGEFTDALDRGDLERAVSLYGGPFLDGFYLSGAVEFERWVELERAEHATRLGATLESLATAAARRKDWRGAAEWWRRVAERDPLNSRIAVSFLDALSVAGDQAGALRFAQLHEKRLREEFDASPNPAVVAAIERARSHAAVVPSSAMLEPIAEPDASVPAVVVLPFVNLSPDREDEYFSDGMTDELINALARMQELRVVSRTSSFALKGKNADVRQIGERLRVDAVVEGSVRKAGTRVRITAQVVTVADGYHVWSETYERTLADVFAAQEELARAIASALSGQLLGKMRTPVGKPATDVPEAYASYLKGRYFSNKRTNEGLRAASEHFQQAIERDPRYALAYAGVAESYALRGFEEFGGDLPPAQAMPPAKAAALRALELDPLLPDAHCWRGVIALLYDWDWALAESEFRRALNLLPRALFPQIWYAVLLGATGRHDESVRLIERAASFEPASLPVQLTAGRCYLFAGQYDAALERIRATLEMDSDNLLAHVWLARALGAKGRLREAAGAVETGMNRFGRLPILLMLSGVLSGQIGQRDEALRILTELREEAQRRYVPVIFEALVLAALGNADEALQNLHQAYQQRSGLLAFAGVLRWEWDSLRADLRFTNLLKKVHRPS